MNGKPKDKEASWMDKRDHLLERLSAGFKRLDAATTPAARNRIKNEIQNLADALCRLDGGDDDRQ